VSEPHRRNVNLRRKDNYDSFGRAEKWGNRIFAASFGVMLLAILFFFLLIGVLVAVLIALL